MGVDTLTFESLDSLPAPDKTIANTGRKFNGLVHSAVYYDNYLIDSNGKIGEEIDTFVSDNWTIDFIMADVKSALLPCNSVEEFIPSN